MSQQLSEVAKKIFAWRNDPVQFVRDNFQVEPDAWQVQLLRFLPDPAKNRIAMQSAVGPGKSAALAWIGWWFLSVMGDQEDAPKGAVVAISGDNLKDNLWAEFAKWQERSAFLKKAFVWTSERIYSKEFPQTWWLSARTWAKKASPDEQGRTLSGFHSGYILYLIDESGEIPPAVLRAAEQGLSKTKWGKIIQAGNPTSHHGMLYDVAKNQPHKWEILRITGDPDDPNRSPRIDAQWVRDNVALHGRNNPWIMSQFFAEFPPASIDSLFSPDELAASQKLNLLEPDYTWAQKRIGVDVALQGNDATIIAPRQGLRAFPMIEMRGAQPNEIAARVAHESVQWGCEAIFIDNTGGFGSGVINQLQMAGQPVFGVHFGQAADDHRYKNKRSEMWLRMRDWIRGGGLIPIDQILVKEMCGPTYTFDSGKFVLEEKKMFKKRIGFSPDRADALALTFAIAEAPTKSTVPIPGFRGKELQSDWNPFDQE